MVAQYKDKIEEALADKDRIKQAMATAIHDALLKHKQAGNSVVCMKDGKMVLLPPRKSTHNLLFIRRYP